MSLSKETRVDIASRYLLHRARERARELKGMGKTLNVGQLTDMYSENQYKLPVCFKRARKDLDRLAFDVLLTLGNQADFEFVHDEQHRSLLRRGGNPYLLTEVDRNTLVYPVVLGYLRKKLPKMDQQAIGNLAGHLGVKYAYLEAFLSEVRKDLAT